MPTTQHTAPAAKQTSTSYHWIMSIQASDGRMNTRSAVADVPSGFTRQQVFQFVVKQFTADYDGPITILFFDLQPNRL